MTTGQAPPVTVIIPTRDRQDSVVRTLRTLLSSDYPAFEVHVVDQSESGGTESAVKGLSGDARIQYTRSATRGLSAALNCGIGGATSELIAITGDDCEVRADWLKTLTAPLSVDRRIGIVFGNVVPGPHDPARGFVPAYVRTTPVLAHGIRDAHLVGGTSASMALRKSVWRKLRGFDEMLGVGAPLGAAEDTDLTIRALLDGELVYETPEAVVIHHGFFPWDQRKPLIQRNWFGTGAAFAKSLKHGHLAVLAVLTRLGGRWVRGRLSPMATSLDHPPRWAILAAFVRGFAAGVLVPIDRVSGHYQPACPRHR
jgi:glycosyltransferase involved in cell wall biosynthesis